MRDWLDDVGWTWGHPGTRLLPTVWRRHPCGRLWVLERPVVQGDQPAADHGARAGSQPRPLTSPVSHTAWLLLQILVRHWASSIRCLVMCCYYWLIILILISIVNPALSVDHFLYQHCYFDVTTYICNYYDARTTATLREQNTNGSYKHTYLHKEFYVVKPN